MHAGCSAFCPSAIARCGGWLALLVCLQGLHHPCCGILHWSRLHLTDWRLAAPAERLDGPDVLKATWIKGHLDVARLLLDRGRQQGSVLAHPLQCKRSLPDL
jgi:hypothetical protein